MGASVTLQDAYVVLMHLGMPLSEARGSKGCSKLRFPHHLGSGRPERAFSCYSESMILTPGKAGISSGRAGGFLARDFMLWSICTSTHRLLALRLIATIGVLLLSTGSHMTSKLIGRFPEHLFTALCLTNVTIAA